MDDHLEVPEPRRPADDVRSLPDPLHWAEVLAELHRWATPALTAEDLPVFGSPAWCALADEEPEKTFAAGRAALAWWTDQVAQADQRAADHIATSHAIAAAENWAVIARTPTHAELERRRRRD